MKFETYREKRLAAAQEYRKECLNARGEVECSECGMSVPEPRANRNAQELAREKIRKNDEGPICNACTSSWRYSHHQDAEVEMANSKDEVQQYVRKQYSIEWDGGSGRELLSMLQKNHVSQQAITRIMARLADNPYAKPLANAQTDSITAEDPNLVENAAFVYVGDEVKVKDDPGLWIVMDFDGGTYTLKGMGGIRKVKAEQIMRNKVTA